MEIFSQIMIFMCGASAIWLVGRTESWKRWGYIVGMLGQPFWLYVTWTNEQYGIFALCLFYVYSWGQGIYNYWIKKPKPGQIMHVSSRARGHIDKSGHAHIDSIEGFDKVDI